MTGQQRGSRREYPGAPVLSLVADLSVSVGDSTARLSGAGQDLVMTTSDPLSFWNALSTSDLPSGVGCISGPRALGRLADLMSDVGITFALVGPSGELVRLGHRGRSAVVATMTGSKSIQLGNARALLPLISGWLGQTVTKRRRPIAVAAAVVALGVVIRSRLVR